MRIAVTGGAGFIGSAFARHMMARGDVEALAVFDALTYAANPHNLDSIMDDSRFSFIKGDIRKRKDVDALMRDFRPDIIVNFAAESHVDRSIENPSLFIETNVEGTGVLMDGCLEYGIRRFHQVSTDEVYGDTDASSGARFTESSPLFPSSPYSASKAAADLLCLSYRRTYGLPVTISRCTNNFGEGQHPEKLIPKAIALALEDKPIPIYGDGSNIREWISADDHSAAIEMILRHGVDGRIYNIGTGLELSNLELVRMILSLLGKDESLIAFTEDRKGHDRRYALDSSRLRDELGISFGKEETEARLERTILALSCKTSPTSL